ncbi:MAG: SH3 domain-containing protein [Clostridium sp.]|uniref:C40 family peptidase n=1 Tax=Clostridium sp. TaxID=1506 RepID=UPI003D6C8934
MRKRIAFIVMLISVASSHVALADSGVINASALRVRQSPQLSASIISSLPRNTKIDTLGKENNFYKINYKGKTGYVYSSYVTITKTSTSPTVAASVGKSGTITAQYLNVRSGSGISYPVTSVITMGTKVTMYEKANGFYKINYSGKTGYISELYVKVTGQNSTNVVVKAISATTTSVATSTEKSTGIGNITASSLNVRKNASLGSNIMGALKTNQKIDLYGSQNGFYKIKFNGQWAYISSSYVTVGSNVVVLGSPALSRGNLPTSKTEYTINGKQYNATKSIDSLIAQANSFLGTPYLWGGTTPAKFNNAGKYVSGGFDCSGLVQYIYKNIGINLPRVTMDQINMGVSIRKNNLQKGDLLFFSTNPSDPYQASHVGIYIGNNRFIQSPKTGYNIKISELTGYYEDNFIVGKRIVK